MDPLAVTSAHPGHTTGLPSLPPAQTGAASRVQVSDVSRLEGIIRCATEAIITINESQTILIFNPMAEKIFGCSAQDAIGTTLERFIPVRDRAGHGDKVRQFGVTGVSDRQLGGQRPLFGLRADGQEFPIEASISQLVDDQGRLFTVMLRDVTDQLKAQAELNASRNELRALSANLQTVRETEKARIARELHDDLGQRLTALKMDLALLEGESDREMGQRRIDAMRDLVDDTVQAVRRIAADLRPVMLDDLGLLPAIEWIANEWRARFGIIVTLDADADAWNTVSPNAATAIFRIVQEALTNIARHANATRATVCLRRTGDAAQQPDAADPAAADLAADAAAGMKRYADVPSCILRISDNGTAVSPASPATAPLQSVQCAAARQPLGLIGMRERARMLEGTLTIEQPAGGGFVVHVILPLAIIDSAYAAKALSPSPSSSALSSSIWTPGRPTE